MALTLTPSMPSLPRPAAPASGATGLRSGAVGVAASGGFATHVDAQPKSTRIDDAEGLPPRGPDPAR